VAAAYANPLTKHPSTVGRGGGGSRSDIAADVAEGAVVAIDRVGQRLIQARAGDLALIEQVRDPAA
jgi:hypothetical protein